MTTSYYKIKMSTEQIWLVFEQKLKEFLEMESLLRLESLLAPVH